MQSFAYRYKPVHAAFEKLVGILSPLFPVPEGKPLVDPPRKILVLKFGGVGEAVLARSLVEHLRRRNPVMDFDFLVEDRTMEAMTSGTACKVISYNPRKEGLNRAIKTVRQIRSRTYDAVLDFEPHSTLTAGFMRATSIPARIGLVAPEPSPRSRFLTHPVQLREDESMWKAFVRMGHILDPELPETLTTIPLPCSAESERSLDEWWAREIGNDKESRVVAMHVGVGPSAQYRRWPIERFVHFATAMLTFRKNLIVILTGGASEQPLIDAFKSSFGGRTVDASALGRLESTAALLRRCDLLVSGDTGIMHLGAAMGTPTVGLFGPNTPKCWGPVGACATWVYPTRQPSSPCINSYKRRIPERCTATVESACM